MSIKSQWVLFICLGLLLVIFGCAMEVSLLTARDSSAARAGFGFVILGGLYLIIEKGFKSKPSKAALEIELEKEKVLQSPLIQDKRVVNFYQTTLTAWSSGKLASLSDGFKTGADAMQLAKIIKAYPPYKGSALRVFFDNFQPREGEFLIGNGNTETVENSGWFVLTNIRLIQRDGRNNEFKEVALADIDSYQSKSGDTLTLVLKMKSGEEITFEKLQLHPAEEYLTKLISQSIVA